MHRACLIILTLACASCLPNYQWSPYVELGYRDEGFSNSVTDTDYGGETVKVGARAIPDLNLSPLTVAQLTGNGSNGADMERLASVRANLAAEQAKVTAMREKITHLEADLASSRTEKAAVMVALSATKNDLAATKVKLAEASDWMKMVRDLFSEWGVIGSFAVLVLVLIGWVYWTKRPKKAEAS